MIPDELIKIFFMGLTIILTFNLLMAGLSSNFEEIEEVTGFVAIEDLDQCDFSPDFESKFYYELPYSRTFFSDVFPEPGSANYQDGIIRIRRQGNLNEELFLIGQGTNEIYLEEGNAGGYSVEFDPEIPVNFTRTEIMGSIPENNSRIQINAEVFANPEDQEPGERKEKVFKYNESIGSGTNRYVFDEINQIAINQSIVRFTYLISREDENIESPEINYIRWDHFDQYEQEEITLTDNLECSQSVILNFGRVSFVDTGITAIDTFLSFIGIFVLIIAGFFAGIIEIIIILFQVLPFI